MKWMEKKGRKAKGRERKWRKMKAGSVMGEGGNRQTSGRVFW